MSVESSTIRAAIERILPADAGAMARAEARQLDLTKPPGAWGVLKRSPYGWRVSSALSGPLSVARPS